MTDPDLPDGDRSIALNYVTATRRAAVLALWQLDDMLGRVVSSTTEPMIGQMRLTWWHERLCALDIGQLPAEPLLGRLAEDVLPCGVMGAELAVLIEGWEMLLEPMPLDAATLVLFAEKRGATLFALSARLLGAATGAAESGFAESGEGWALVDFAVHCSDLVTAERALALARERLKVIGKKTPKALRVLARLARAKAVRTEEAAGEPLGRFDFLRAVLG